MKTIILSKVILLVIIVSVACLSGCDEKKNNNIGILMALLAGTSANQPLTVKDVSPVNGSNGLSQHMPVIITFNKPTDGVTFGTVALTYIYGWDDGVGLTTPSVFPDGPECDMFFNTKKNILTIWPMYGYALGAPYSHIIVSGFRDAAGNLMEDYEDPDYHFTMKSWPSVVMTPYDEDTIEDLSVDIKINFDGDLDEEVIGSVSLIEGTDTVITYTDSVNCTISISRGFHGSVVTINHDNPFIEDTAYSKISVSGFIDPYGNDVADRTFEDYNFTTVGIN